MKKSLLALAMLGALSMSTFAGEIGSSRTDNPDNQSTCFAGEIGSSVVGEIGSSLTCASQNQSAQNSGADEDSSDSFDISGVLALLGF